MARPSRSASPILTRSTALLAATLTLGGAAAGLNASRKEPLVALGFGMVHGLAFATVLAELGFRGRSLAAALVQAGKWGESAPMPALPVRMGFRVEASFTTKDALFV